MPKLTSAADGRPGTATVVPGMRVVLVTMDSHLASAAERAHRSLARAVPGLSLVVHAASEWRDDAAALQRCIDDIHRGDIVLVSMLFMEDHFLPVLPALQARRDQCDAMVCLMSAAEVTRLTRMGKFDMSAPSTGPMAFLKKLRGKSSADVNTSAEDKTTAGARQMRMLRRLPKILRFIPGTAQDVRAYFLTMQYWLAGSEQNMFNLVQFLVDRYAAGARRGLRGTLKPAFRWSTRRWACTTRAWRSACRPGWATCRAWPPAAKGAPWGLLVMRSYLLAGNTGHYDGVITALEARGMKVIPAFATGLDNRPAIDAYFFKDGQPAIDAMVSLTGFSLIGGPAYNDAHAAEHILAKLDVPYLAVTRWSSRRWTTGAPPSAACCPLSRP